MDAIINNDRLHSIKSAAEFLGGVSESRIRVWLWREILQRVKVGRRTMLRESELLALIHEEIALSSPSDRQGAATHTAPQSLHGGLNEMKPAIKLSIEDRLLILWLSWIPDFDSSQLARSHSREVMQLSFSQCRLQNLCILLSYSCFRLAMPSTQGLE